VKLAVAICHPSTGVDSLNEVRIGVSIDDSAGAADGHSCALMGTASPNPALFDVLVTAQATHQNDNSQDIAPIAEGDQIAVIGQRVRNPDVLHCRVLVNGLEVMTSLLTASSTWPAGGRIGVRSTFASASLRYVAVYVAP
jgi:hypothetical protein